MKKISCLILAILIAMTCFSFTVNVFAAPAEPDMTAAFNSNWPGTSVPVHNGLKYTTAASLDNNASVGNYKTTLITPKSSNNPVVLLHQSIPNMKISLEGLRYIRYYCYFGEYGNPGHTTFDGRAKLVLKASEFNLTDDCTVYSTDPITPNEWTYITFDVGEVINSYRLAGSIVPEMEFYPYGDTPSNELSESDKIAFLQMYALAQGSKTAQAAVISENLVPKYPIYFVPGRADAEGTMETMYAANDETIVLPECEFTREGYEFVNWICSYGAEYYYPGDEYTVTTFNYNSPVGIETGHRYFFANWKKSESGDDDEEETAVPEVALAGYSDYWGGLVKPAAQTYQYTYATPYKDYEFDGINTLRLTFNPEDKDANRVVNLDGHTYNKIPLDIAHYKYLAIPYYFKTSREKSPFNSPRWAFLIGNTKALKTSTTIVASSGQLKTNQWAFMIFEFDFINNATLNKNLNPDSGTTIINQCHFYPFGNNSTPSSTACGFASKMLPDEEIYFGNFIFMSEIPEVDPTIEKGFINGYEDGTFRPANILTKAEASVILAKAMGVPELETDEYPSTYSDIAFSDYDWCRSYVGYLENKGIIPASDGEKFNPNSQMTTSDFMKLAVKARVGVTGTTDVGKLIDGSSVELLTRAKAVSLIYTVLKDTSEAYTSSLTTAFTDVTPSVWNYADIARASNAYIGYTDANGKYSILEALGKISASGSDSKVHGVTAEQIAEGDAYLAELENITTDRINEIRYSESEYSLKPGGRIWYVSSSNGTKTGGKTEENPLYIEKLDEVSDIPAVPGDVILFKRGDTFRGKMNAIAGVTYSAFGDGDKPLLTRSPENGSGKSKWTLDYSDDSGKKIWKYYNESYVDVGAINLFNHISDNTVAYKEVPSFIDGKFWVRGYKPGENSAYPNGYEFDYVEQLDHNLEFFHKADSICSSYIHNNIGTNTAPDLNSSIGPIYLRCDEGNPGELYSNIEFNIRTNCISVSNKNNVTVDNLCIMFFGSHGIGAGSVNNLKVTNCEIGWGGGAIQNYQTSANYTNPGHVVRFGNGIEIYGGCGNYTIDNCYVYQIYDAGITHQVSGHSNGNYYMQNVLYTNNVLTDSIYNIEYFLTQNNTKNADGTLPTYERIMDNVIFRGNICRRAGYGWGVQRPDGNVPSNIRGWGTHNLTNNYVIEDNIFDRCVDFKSSTNDFVTSIGSAFETALPFLKNNIYVQVPGRDLTGFGTVAHYVCDKNSEKTLESFGGVGNKVYFVSDDQEEASTKVFWRK